MASPKKRPQPAQPQARKAAAAPPRAPLHEAKSAKGIDPAWLPWLAVGLTALAYLPVFGAEFVNWDDGDYVYDKGKRLLADNSKIWELLTTPVQGNFHPLTMLSLKINYWISGMEPWSYHALNLVFHLANTLLSWRLAMRLSQGNALVAFLTALFFGLHPMHVESVAWVSERKDVLYSLFFLAGLLQYLRYVDTGKMSAYALALLLGGCALMSKPAAVVFPAVLFAVDYLRARPLGVKLFVEKIPFFALALGLAFLTLKYQSDIGATEGTAIFGWGTRFLFACYGLMMYIVKLVLPYPCVPFYPYPPLNQAPTLPYLVSPVFVAGLVALTVWGHLKGWRAVPFALAFYVLNLALVLQLLPVGSAVIAERYTYMPYFGLFFGLGWALDKWLGNKNLAWGLVFGLGTLYAGLTFVQAGVWKKGETLWDHAIKHHPSSRAYVNRAVLYRKEMTDAPAGDPNKKALGEKAIQAYAEAIRMNARDHEAHASRGNIYFDFGRYKEAIADYDVALSYKPGYVPSLDNRGAAYAYLLRFDEAYADFAAAQAIDSTYKTIYRNRAVTFFNQKRYAEAQKDFLKFLQFEPLDFAVMNSVGVCEQGLGQFEQSITTFNNAIAGAQQELSKKGQKPQEVAKLNGDLTVLFENRSLSYYNLSLSSPERRDALYEAARKDAQTVAQRGKKLDPNYLRVLGL